VAKREGGEEEEEGQERGDGNRDGGDMKDVCEVTMAKSGTAAYLFLIRFKISGITCLCTGKKCSILEGGREGGRGVSVRIRNE
jgi:hypothetical protein